MNPNDFEIRLQSLEKRLTRARATTALLGLGVIGLLGLAASSPNPVTDEVRTRKLVVVTADGKEALRLVTTEQGCALAMHNRAGYAVVVLGADDRGGELHLSDKDGIRCTTITANDGGGQLTLQNKAGQKHSLSAQGAGKQEK